ncbi:hypothetical protein RUM44_005193 [Polyplax serrata]|uniref:Urea transporter n=1 Tax=Polyplax serrata TaxID=468196 RepID=A0ABR1AEB7_POLSC
MSDGDRGRHPKNIGKKIPQKLLLFGGDCHAVNEFLITKSEKSIFALLQYLNSLLRSFGYVIQANNPISGLFIILAIGIASYKAMFSALLMSSLAFIFAKLIQQDILGNLNGFFSYNAVLHAVVSVGYVPTVYSTVSVSEPKFWLFLFMYILIFCLLNNTIPPRILSSHLLDPPIKWSGNHSELADQIKNESFMINSTLSSPDLNGSRQRRDVDGENYLEALLDNEQKWTSTDDNIEIKLPEEEQIGDFSNATHLHWGEFFSGTIMALSQVYGLNDIPCSVLMFLALVVYSPTTALFSYAGSFVGTLLGVFLTSDYEKVYNGTWGYNGLLSSGALAGFGFVLTPQSAFLAFIAVLFCTVFQHFITPLFDSINVPVFHIPFIVTTFIFLLVSAEVEKALPRPGIYTYPEKHRREFKNANIANMEGYLNRARGSDEV